MNHFADRLIEAIETKGGPVCVGIDPVYERLPDELRTADCRDSADVCAVIKSFVTRVLNAVGNHVPCVKFQSACFERYLWNGIECYWRCVAAARQRGLIVIGDVKRGDIGSSAEHYAAGHLIDPDFTDCRELGSPDAITVNAWCGADGIVPFAETAAANGKGLFVWVRASNPSSDAFQGQTLKGGGTVAESLGRIVAEAGDAEDCVGDRGYSLIGAVVGATKPEDAARLRRALPRQFFLVPGFGAQGGTADDIRPCFNPDGRGALVTASRSITYAYQRTDTEDWQGAIEQAAVEMKQQVNAAIG